MTPKNTKTPKDSEEATPKSLSLNRSGTIWLPVAVQRAWGLEGLTGTLYYVLKDRQMILMPSDEAAKYM
jgi:hypothetical protein